MSNQEIDPVTQFELRIRSNIREMRKKLGLTQGELAERAGRSQQWVHAVENGGTRLRITTVYGLATALGCPVGALTMTTDLEFHERERIINQYDVLNEEDRALFNAFLSRLAERYKEELAQKAREAGFESPRRLMELTVQNSGYPTHPEDDEAVEKMRSRPSTGSYVLQDDDEF